MYEPKFIRNVAIVAHIDHGKTTLLDGLFKQCEALKSNEVDVERAMDQYDIEKERGITIFAKHTSLFFEEYKINLIDTPGHADFSGEVERILGMVNSVILLIDSAEGPKPQTRFVLSKALKKGLCPLVVLNKIDRKFANAEEALNKTFDLFVELGASDEQLDFSYCYASGLTGFAKKKLEDPHIDMRPLFELIVEKVPPPSGHLNNPFLMQAMTLSYSDFVGRGATGRILDGKIKKGDTVTKVDQTGHPSKHKITLIEGYHGLQKIEMSEAGVGDIVNISGIADIMIGDTLSDPGHVQRLEPIELGEPTISVDILVNTSPFVGRDGKHVTMNKIRDRLMREKRSNVSLKIEEIPGREDVIRMCGRGEMHLSIVIETMRREGFEFSVSRPKVITKEINGETHEPFETAHIEVKEEYSGKVIEELSRRKGELQSLATDDQKLTTMEFLIPTRGLMGFRGEFLTITRGEGVLTSTFAAFHLSKGKIPTRLNGVMIANESGRTTPYSIFNLRSRGTFFIGPGADVYEGMIIGENNKNNDLVINTTKEKKLTNVRASGTDENITLTRPRPLTLEAALDYIQDDELVEVTPKFIRLRKIYLKEVDRKRNR